MSLRWHLSGLQLSTFWARLGSNDESLLRLLRQHIAERLQRSVDSNWFDRDEADFYRAEVVSVLERAIRKGAPFPELAGESGVHVDVADALARHGQNAYATESWDWKHSAWFEFERLIAPRLPDPEREFLTQLVHGRPIFGPRFVTGWEFYTYLTNAEARALSAAVAAAVAAGPPVPIAPARDFAAELVGWFEAITGRGLDVWVHAD